jgi:hypothetical protein
MSLESLPSLLEPWNYGHLDTLSHAELARLEVILRKKLDLVVYELGYNILIDDKRDYQLVRNYIAKTDGRPYPKERLNQQQQ